MILRQKRASKRSARPSEIGFVHTGVRAAQGRPLDLLPRALHARRARGALRLGAGDDVGHGRPREARRSGFALTLIQDPAARSRLDRR